MQHRFAPAVRTCALATLAGFLSACGGGGGGGSTPSVGTSAVPAPPGIGTIAAGTPQSNAGGSGGGAIKTDTTFSITTNPTGLTVTADGASLGTSPISSYMPTAASATSATANQLVFSGGPTEYTVDVTQTRDGARRLYYNAAADSSGAIDATSIKAAARSTLGAAAGERFVRRPFALHAGAHAADVVPNEFVVRYKPASLSSARRQPADVERGVGVVGKSLPTTGDPLRAVVVPTGQSPADFVRKLAVMPEVAYVHPVHVRHLLSRAATTVIDPLYVTPNDQWYLHAVGAPFAWAYSTGQNVTIAVVDTGFDNNNTDLAGKVTRQGRAVSPTDGGGNVTTPATLKTGGTAAQDSNGHGTSVSGLAGAATNNTYGLASLGYNVKLFVYDVFADTTVNVPEPAANGVDEATAIDDAVSNGADIISLSLGALSPDDAEQSAVEFAISKGVTVIAAAGNNADGQDGSGNAAASGTLDFPGGYDGVISVGASALSDGNTSGTNDGVYDGSSEFVAGYSQYGTGLGLVAPGGSVSPGNDADVLHWILTYSTTTTPVTANQCTQKNGTCLALFEGTSQATPQVSAAAALLLSLAGGHGALTPAQIAQVLYNTADNINDSHQGHGRLNVYRALAGYLHDTSAPTGPTATSTGATQFVAFAYNNHGANRPTILDVNYPSGVPVDASGGFRIADVPASAGSYTVGVWYDANGNGYIDPGDQVAIARAACSATAPCSIGTLTVKTVSAPYALP